MAVGRRRWSPANRGAKLIISFHAFREDIQTFLGKGTQIYILD